MTAHDDRQGAGRTRAAASEEPPLPLTRRRFLGGASGAALVGTTALSPWLLAGCVKPTEEPWSDGTYWSDGTGWVEESGWFTG